MYQTVVLRARQCTSIVWGVVIVNISLLSPSENIATLSAFVSKWVIAPLKYTLLFVVTVLKITFWASAALPPYIKW